MKTLSKILGVTALATVVTGTAMVQDAEAQRYRRGAAIGLGIVGGALIAGAIAESARARDRGYYAAPAYGYAPAPAYGYAPPRGPCGHLRRKAAWHEENGHPRRAAYYWAQFRECRGGY